MFTRLIRLSQTSDGQRRGCLAGCLAVSPIAWPIVFGRRIRSIERPLHTASLAASSACLHLPTSLHVICAVWDQCTYRKHSFGLHLGSSRPNPQYFMYPSPSSLHISLIPSRAHCLQCQNFTNRGTCNLERSGTKFRRHMDVCYRLGGN